MKPLSIVRKIQILLLFIFLSGCKNDTKQTISTSSNSLLHLNLSEEVHDKFLLTPENHIIYSTMDNNNYSLRIYHNGRIDKLFPESINIFNPILISGEVTALQDHYGDEKFKLLGSELIEYIGNNPINVINSFNNGSIVLVQLQNSSELLLINLKNKTKSIIAEINQKINGTSFSDITNHLIISYDNELIDYNLNNNQTVVLANCMDGSKQNPQISNNDVYFVNNSQSDYYEIFKTSIFDSTAKGIISVLKSNHDLRLPKIKNNFLYYIEVVNSEYLLKRIDLKTKNKKKITHKGVVYNYEFLYDNQIVMTYSDFITPKCIMIYKELYDSLFNLTGSNINQSLSFQLIKDNKNNSSAYLFKPDSGVTKGVVLYLGPGIHSDFSPRWDNLLMNICSNGYIILAPNSPMSFGYGKKYFSATFDDLFNDTKKWKHYLMNQYNEFPLFCIASSSGNISLEYLSTHDSEGIKAAASLFGLSINSVSSTFSMPTLYILGENDPKVDFKQRFKALNKNSRMNSTITVVSYPDEGHWFRSYYNYKDAMERILYFFQIYGKVENSKHIDSLKTEYKR